MIHVSCLIAVATWASPETTLIGAGGAPESTRPYESSVGFLFSLICFKFFLCLNQKFQILKNKHYIVCEESDLSAFTSIFIWKFLACIKKIQLFCFFFKKNNYNNKYYLPLISPCSLAFSRRDTSSSLSSHRLASNTSTGARRRKSRSHGTCRRTAMWYSIVTTPCGVFCVDGKSSGTFNRMIRSLLSGTASANEKNQTNNH